MQKNRTQYFRDYYLKNKQKKTAAQKLRMDSMPFGGKLYKTWVRIKNRCFNPKTPGYKNWGGRGISVSKEWVHNFERFRDDMLPSFIKHVNEHGLHQTSIDRIDNNGNYCKSNCRWATYTVQAQNRRRRISTSKRATS